MGDSEIKNQALETYLLTFNSLQKFVQREDYARRRQTD